MRRTLIGALLIGLGMLGWYLNGLIDHSAWITNVDYGQQTGNVYQRWDILRVLWPLTLFAVLAGGVLALCVIIPVYYKGEEVDHKREVERLTLAGQKARKEVEDEYEKERTAIEEVRELSYQRLEQAKQHERALNETLAAVYNERDEARQDARKTKFAYERKVKHAEALQTQVEALQKRLNSIMQRTSPIPQRG